MAFRKATVAGTKALMCLYAESGGGKTYSALLLARGLAGPEGRIAMIDTENRRGELYADDPAIGGYDVMQLEAPFSPKRYIAAIDEAEREGYDAIVIDSGSHEWEGEGGVVDHATSIAEARAKKYNREFDGTVQFGDWKEPKTDHKHLIQRLQRCKAHVIVCLRAQYKSRQVDQKDYEKFGIQSRAKTTVIRDEYQSAIQDERFIFEVTIHAQMSNANPGVPIITKCPQMLLSAFPEGKRISVETGERMAAFYDRGAPATMSDDKVITEGEARARQGVESYRTFFENLPGSAKRVLVETGQHDRFKKIAADAEKPDPIDELAPQDNDGPDDDDFPGDTVRKPGDSGYVKPNFDD